MWTVRFGVSTVTPDPLREEEASVPVRDVVCRRPPRRTGAVGVGARMTLPALDPLPTVTSESYTVVA